MTERPERPQRVRVTGPPRRSRAPVDRTREVEQQTRLGGVMVRSLVRTQVRLATRTLLLLALTIGLLPVLLWAAPGLARVHLAGLPLPWLVPGVLAYPWLVVLAWRHVVAAERAERDWLELMSPASDRGGAP